MLIVLKLQDLSTLEMSFSNRIVALQGYGTMNSATSIPFYGGSNTPIRFMLQRLIRFKATKQTKHPFSMDVLSAIRNPMTSLLFFVF